MKPGSVGYVKTNRDAEEDVPNPWKPEGETIKQKVEQFEQKVEHIQSICNPLYNVGERTLKNLKSFHPYDHKMELNRKYMPYQGSNEPFCQLKFRNRDDLLN